jgi:hypothetical protein
VTELPTFDWITEPQTVPVALKKLNPKQRVVCVICNDKARQSPLTHEAKVQEHIAEIESLMSRQAIGRYTIDEIATILAKENKLDKSKFLMRLQEAANDKKLPVSDPDTSGTPIAPNAQTLIFSHWVSPDAVNALLKEWGVIYRFAWPRPWCLPTFNVPVRPTCVPPELAKLPNEAQVRIKFSTVRVEAISTGSAADLVKLFQEIIERQGKELFTLDEAAQVLADSLVGVSSRAMLKDMRDAHKGGSLIIRDPGKKMPRAQSGKVIDLTDLVKISDVDAWFESQGSDERFPKAQQPLNDIAPSQISLSVATTDYSKLATRQQLINAFAAFTGMDMTWFNNLKDIPKLKAARKVVGQGQRGQKVEPCFCPYEVMQWLTDPKRKKGRPLSSNKGWQILENNFASVYNHYSIGDTRETLEVT